MNGRRQKAPLLRYTELSPPILDTVTPEECSNYFRHAGYGSN